ncbi:MAG TPA: hypothetical protein VLC98_07735 [Phnomibacter sp.]|nr:hypothetical protein [Phnomibacter sp.]
MIRIAWKGCNSLLVSGFMCSVLVFMCTGALAQNVGIGVANPQKGKLEIAGALGGFSTVLTIGSDGQGISLQRNWPSIGFNQYRDASNVQRYIGAGYASIIFMNPQDGSIVISQLGQGTANQEITANTYPLFIDAFGSTNLNGTLKLKEPAYLDKELVFNNEPKIFGSLTGTNVNLLPRAQGVVQADGSKFRGTSNFTSAYNANLQAYLIYVDDLQSTGSMIITPQTQTPCFPTYAKLGQGIYLVKLWNTSGNAVAQNFSFCFYLL